MGLDRVHYLALGTTDGASPLSRASGSYAARHRVRPQVRSYARDRRGESSHFSLAYAPSRPRNRYGGVVLTERGRRLSKLEAHVGLKSKTVESRFRALGLKNGPGRVVEGGSAQLGVVVVFETPCPPTQTQSLSFPGTSTTLLAQPSIGHRAKMASNPDCPGIWTWKTTDKQRARLGGVTTAGCVVAVLPREAG